VTVFLASVGLILTPIYLLSMLRQVFYGDGSSCDITNITPNKSNEQAVCFGTSCVLPDESEYIDAKPREIFIAVSFLALIVAIGFYPQLATRIYDVKTVAVNSEVRQAYREIAATRQNIYAETKPDVSAKVASIFQ
jgi:NAD(P)H-quinone oxidoreductase subunit 4